MNEEDSIYCSVGGKLPNYFSLWLATCKWNPTIDFIIFTDDRTEFDYPNNVMVHYMEFSEIKKLVKRNFDFSISLDAPYKLCDFRPVYGEIFSEYLPKYDYWGRCSLYKNTQEVNAWYRMLPCNGYQNWKDVFQSLKSCCFDEWGGHCGGGISQIMQSNGIKIYDKVCTPDLNVMKEYFRINQRADIHDKNIYFAFDKGKLEMIRKNSEGFLCYHFQKRKIVFDYYIDNNSFIFTAPNIVTSNKNFDKNNKGKKFIYTYGAFLDKIKKIDKKE